MKQRCEFAILNCVLPLLFGAFIYWHFRPDAWITRFIDCIFGKVPEITEENRAINDTILRLCKFYLPDILWSYSLTSAVCLILSRPRISVILSMSFSFLTEFFQLTRILPGTFDWADVVLEWMASLTAAGLFSVFLYPKNIKKE